MKHNIAIFIFILCLGNFIKAQNLVLNSSFEQHTQCPNQESQISYCNNWEDGVTHGSCDYYSALNCTGNFSPPLLNPSASLVWYQQPLSGKSFAGFIPYYGNPGAPSTFAEFLQGKFNSSLTTNKLYYIEYYIVSASNVKYFLHDIAALLTDTTDPNNLQNYTPQILPAPHVIYKDTVKWMKINGYYTAQGGEKYITIGNYTPYGQELKDSTISYMPTVAYYFVDSVGVYEVTHLDIWNAGPDKYINYGDSVQIGNPNTDYSMFNWVDSTNTVTYLSDSTDAHPWSKPVQTTIYYVTKTQGTNVFKDTVTVYVIGGVGIQQVAGNNMQIKIYPNPNKGNFLIETNTTEEQTLQIFDVTSKMVLNQNINGKTNIDASNLDNGMYFIQVKTKENIYKQKIIVQH